MDIQVDNPVCILTQETAKNFLHSSDDSQKYKLFEQVTLLKMMNDQLATAMADLSQSTLCLREKLQVISTS